MAKAPPPRPAPRLYLQTPIIADAASIATVLQALSSAADVAAVLLRLAPSDPRGLLSIIKALAPVVQAGNAALLIDGHPDLVARGGADGAHVAGIDTLQDVLPMLKPNRIVGAGGLVTRHDAMTAGETGADYVLFGERDRRGERPATEAIAERLDWWAELFEPPCVGFAESFEDARIFAEAGADFVLVGDCIWNDPRGAATALMDAAHAIRLDASAGTL